MKMTDEGVHMEFTEDGKILIIEQSAVRLIKKEEFFDLKYKPVAEKLHDLLEFGDQFGPVMVATVVAISHFKWKPDDVVEKFKNRALFNDVFEALRTSGEIDKILETATAIHAIFDPASGDFKQQSLH